MKRIYVLREQAKGDGEPILREKSFELLIEKVKEKQPKKILEIGVNRGLSGIAMLLNSKNATLSGIEIDEQDEPINVFEKICAARKFLLKRNEPDWERCAKTVLDDFRKGRLGKIYLD